MEILHIVLFAIWGCLWDVSRGRLPLATLYQIVWYCKVVLYFVFVKRLVERLGVFLFGASLSPGVRGFLSVLMSTWMSDDGRDRDAF